MIILGKKKKLHQNLRNTLPLCSLPTENRLQRSFGYSRSGKMVPRLWFSTRPFVTKPDKDNYESDYKQNSGSRVYLRASNWSIIPTPITWVGSLLTHRIERRLRTTDAREPKSGALLDRFFLENARKKFHSQFTFSILSPSFVTENRPSLSFSLFSLSRELLRTFANKFLIFFHSP